MLHERINFRLDRRRIYNCLFITAYSCHDSLSPSRAVEDAEATICLRNSRFRFWLFFLATALTESALQRLKRTRRCKLCLSIRDAMMGASRHVKLPRFDKLFTMLVYVRKLFRSASSESTVSLNLRICFSCRQFMLLTNKPVQRSRHIQQSPVTNFIAIIQRSAHNANFEGRRSLLMFVCQQVTRFM